ncbi:helix-turn-helix domain-containing protein [Pseudonocardia sp. DLS-67]
MGERVRELRLAHQLSQAELARRLDLDRTAVVRVEAGERQVSALELGQLADIFDVPIAHFVTKPPASVTSYRTPIADELDKNARDRVLLDIDLEGHARDAEWLKQQGFLSTTSLPIFGPVPDIAAATGLAKQARNIAGIESGPVPRLVDAAEKFGLYILVVDRDASGASLQLDRGFGVAVVGGRAQPGRRRWTAAHEIGHHLIGDAYHSDVGVSASEDEKEAVIDAFVAEFLLPRDEVRTAWESDPLADPYPKLVKLAAAYRISWSATVAAATASRVIERSDAQRLRARTPTRGDFLEVVGAEPRPDLDIGATGPAWKRAVLGAWRAGRISTDRARALLHESLDLSEFPQRDVDATC